MNIQMEWVPQFSDHHWNSTPMVSPCKCLTQKPLKWDGRCETPQALSVTRAKASFCVFRELPWSQDTTFSMLDYTNLQSVTASECFKLTEASLIFDVHDIGCLSDLSLPVKIRHSHVWNNFPLNFCLKILKMVHFPSEVLCSSPRSMGLVA